MQELKERLDVIGSVVGIVRGQQNPQLFAQVELGFLQLRYICEIIALAACVAHEPSNLTKSILKSWHAERTFALLEEINEHCFPKAVAPPRESADGSIEFSGIPDALDFEKLKEIYVHCGGVLHRGTPNRLLRGVPRIYDVDKLHAWASLIGRSLANHNVMIPETGSILAVSLNAGPSGEARVFEIQTVDGSPFSISKKWPAGDAVKP